MWVRSAVIARILTALSILILLFVCWNAYQYMMRSEEHLRLTNRRHDVTNALTNVLVTLQNAESSQRGYMLTNNTDYLASYEREAEFTPATLDALQALVDDDHVAQAAVRRLRTATAFKLLELRRIIELRKTEGLQAAWTALATGQGDQLMEAVREIEVDMNQYQRTLLAEEVKRANVDTDESLSLLVTGILVAVLFFLTSSVIVSGELLLSRRNETILAESHSFLRQILVAHPTESLIIDPDGHILEGNRSTEAILHSEVPHGTKTVSYKEILRNLEFIEDTDVALLESAVEDVLRSITIQFQHRVAGGPAENRRQYTIHIKPLTIQSRRHVLLCITDESDSAMARASADLNEEIFRVAMDDAPIGMALVSPQGEWIRVNNAVCEIVGYTEEELLVTDFQTITHPEDLDKDLTLLKQMLNKEIDHYHMEKRYIRKNGDIVWILLSVSLVWDNSDQPLYFISQIQDIDTRKKSEDEIALSKERLELALRGGELGAWDWNVLDGQVYYDERWAAMLGYTVAELASDFTTWDSAIHPEDKDAVVENLEAHFRQETESYEAEHRLKHKDGSWVWVLTKGKVIARDHSGAPARVCGTHLDITLQKTAQEALETFSKELERSNRELEDFAYIASHDLKEPLRGIRNYATFLLEDYEDKLDEDGQDKLHTMVKLTTRLGAFIDALLHYSKVGRTEFALQPVNLHDETIHIVESLKGWLEEQNGHVTVLDSLTEVPCHPVLAAEVFRNLITNGIKYNKADRKEIVVGAEPGSDGKPVFYVRDNGVGIPERHHAAIFKIFKRLHARDEYGGGTGAGLSITQKIVHRHGGRIWLESIENAGTTFYFTLHDDGSPVA